jgi:hypothetical protein
MEETKLYRQAFLLSLFTIFYNILEGWVSVYFGWEEETLTLFGFGMDSFIEAISGLGIAHMVIRIKNHKGNSIDKFEITALKITGAAFYLLSTGLAAGIIIKLINKESPHTTIPGIIISVLSIVVMLLLVKIKTRVGNKLGSSPILADASCTRICIYMSLVLLASSFMYELFKINYIDILGTIGIIYYSIREGKESFDKAKGINACSCDH